MGCRNYLILHVHSPSMPSARRSTEPARPVSEIPILNAALLNTEADVVAALLVPEPEPDVVPPVVEVPGAVVVAPVDVPGAVVPVGETVGAVAGMELLDVEDALVETTAPMENVAVSANTSVTFPLFVNSIM